VAAADGASGGARTSPTTVRTLTVRLHGRLHKRLVQAAERSEVSLNREICQRLNDSFVDSSSHIRGHGRE